MLWYHNFEREMELIKKVNEVSRREQMKAEIKAEARAKYAELKRLEQLEQLAAKMKEEKERMEIAMARKEAQELMEEIMERARAREKAEAEARAKAKAELEARLAMAAKPDTKESAGDSAGAGGVLSAGKQVLVLYDDGTWDVVRYFEKGEIADCGAGYIPDSVIEKVESMEDIVKIAMSIPGQEISEEGLYKEVFYDEDNSFWKRIDDNEIVKAIQLPEEE